MALILALALVHQVFIGLAWAQSAEVQLDLVPETVEVPSRDSRVVVVLRNRGPTRLRDVRLSWFSDTGLVVTDGIAPLEALAPQGEAAWALRLAPERADVEPRTGLLHVRVDYVPDAGGRDRPGPGVTLRSLTVKTRSADLIEEMAAVQVKGLGEVLTEKRPGVAYLVVTNRATVPIRLQSPSVGGPDFICVASASSQEATLLPRQTRVLRLDLHVCKPARPGKSVLVFDMPLLWDREGVERRGNVVVAHEVQAGIPGEADLLGLLGIPSFLVLPGFLMVVTTGFLWGRGFGHLKRTRGDFPLVPRSAEFWVVAITLSGLMALLYPRFTERDYLERYGLPDVWLVWSASIVIGVAGFLALSLGTALYDRVRRARVAALTPGRRDAPVALLRKLHRRGLGITLPRVQMEVQGDTVTGFLLWPVDEGGEDYWVAPTIEVAWLGEREPERRQTIDAHLKSGAPADLLAAELKDAERRGLARAHWAPSRSFDGPLAVKFAQLRRLSDGTIVQVS